MYGALKYANVLEKFNFLETQDLSPIGTCKEHFEMNLPMFILDECETYGKYREVFSSRSNAIAATVYCKNVTENLD